MQPPARRSAPVALRSYLPHSSGKAARPASTLAADQLPLLDQLRHLRAGSDPHAARVFQRRLPRATDRAVADRRGAGRDGVFAQHHRRDAALGRARVRGPLAHLGDPGGRRAGQDPPLHPPRPVEHPQSHPAADPLLRVPRVDPADPAARADRDALLPDQGQGHLAAVLAQADRADRAVQRARTGVARLQRGDPWSGGAGIDLRGPRSRSRAAAAALPRRSTVPSTALGGLGSCRPSRSCGPMA